MSIALIIAAIPVAYLVWDSHFRVFPLSYFGIENVQRIVKYRNGVSGCLLEEE
ncbi:hypothetical protein LEB69_17540 [Salmonella enterica]|nr:hypothetical protein [Salmonella enterica]